MGSAWPSSPMSSSLPLPEGGCDVLPASSHERLPIPVSYRRPATAVVPRHGGGQDAYLLVSLQVSPCGGFGNAQRLRALTPQNSSGGLVFGLARPPHSTPGNVLPHTPAQAFFTAGLLGSFPWFRMLLWADGVHGKRKFLRGLAPSTASVGCSRSRRGKNVWLAFGNDFDFTPSSLSE